MRLVNINYVEEGAVLARPVISPAGKILLQSGVGLTQSYIDRLRRLGFDVLFIEDELFDDVELNMAISAQTRENAYKTIENVCKFIDDGREKSINGEMLKYTVQNMINDLLYSYDLLGNLSEIRGYDDYTYHHSVNTTVLALILGIASGLSESRLLELGMGVLMHDVGKIKVPEEILNKVIPLTKDEFEEVKKHTTYGFELLRSNKDFSLLSAHIALQHQEKWDGSGYPRGLKGSEIHEYGRIAAIADVYEALTSKRVYRDALQPYEAYEYVIAHGGTHFEPKMLEKFIKHVAVYPTGSGIRFSNGQRGNVIKQNPAFPSRPHVRITHQDDNPIVPKDFNLAEHPSLFIVAVENK